MSQYKLLLVDDDPFTLTGMGQNLESAGYDITTAENGETALSRLGGNVQAWRVRLLLQARRPVGDAVL